MASSLWTETTPLPSFQALDGDRKTDVLIIGGGLCGVLCAYYLKKAGIDCLLVEGDRIGSGTTKNSTAKVTALHSLLYASLLEKEGKEKAQMYFVANQEAVQEYKALSETIPCAFQSQTAYTYSCKDPHRLHAEVRALAALGAPASFVEALPLPIETKGAVALKAQGQINPLAFLSGISRGLPIYENTFVEKVEGTTAYTKRGSIKAEKIIIATHFPFLNAYGSYFLKLYQSRSYVLALSGTPEFSGMFIDEDEQGFSFRHADSFLLLGGGSHRTGKKGGSFQALEAFASRHYPKANIQYRWAAQDCMSLDAIPYVGPYSALTPRLYVATGFSKWGITGSMVAARLLCAEMANKPLSYAPVFSPQRSMLKPQLFLNLLESVVGLATPRTRRCPHLGCALHWNPAEHSWDCPCHGSRFSADGKRIDNPATSDLKKE